MIRKTHDKRLRAAMHMPPLKMKPHRDVAYDPSKDEVGQWLARQPEIMSYISALAIRQGYIQFDPATRLWKGVAYEDD